MNAGSVGSRGVYDIDHHFTDFNIPLTENSLTTGAYSICITDYLIFNYGNNFRNAYSIDFHCPIK